MRLARLIPLPRDHGETIVKIVKCECDQSPYSCAVHPYTHWDESVSALVKSNDTHTVEYEPRSGPGKQVIIIKTVWKKAYRQKDQHVAWTGTVMSLDKDRVGDLIGLMIDVLMEAGVGDE